MGLRQLVQGKIIGFLKTNHEIVVVEYGRNSRRTMKSAETTRDAIQDYESLTDKQFWTAMLLSVLFFGMLASMPGLALVAVALLWNVLTTLVGYPLILPLLPLYGVTTAIVAGWGALELWSKQKQVNATYNEAITELRTIQTSLNPPAPQSPTSPAKTDLSE